MAPAERAQLPSCAAVDAPKDACTACERDDGAKCWVVSEALEHGDLRAKALFNARGCELGHVRSCMDLGQAYKRGVLPRPAGVHGVLLEESACREARARCIAGDLAHCATAAGCDRLGHGTTTRRLRRQVVAACDNGHGDACTELAIADPARLLEWTRRVDRFGAVERAESVHSSGHPETDILYLALIRNWRLEPRTTAIQRCWSVSVLTWFSRT